MNLLELQQRANVLVQKVNDYEASLTGTTIDETSILNQHIYADLYCLRPVMKLLFGATADERLSRTLDNDVALRAFSSSAPANNTTFNLLSYNPGETYININWNKSPYPNVDGIITRPISGSSNTFCANKAFKLAPDQTTQIVIKIIKNTNDVGSYGYDILKVNSDRYDSSSSKALRWYIQSYLTTRVEHRAYNGSSQVGNSIYRNDYNCTYEILLKNQPGTTKALATWNYYSADGVLRSTVSAVTTSDFYNNNDILINFGNIPPGWSVDSNQSYIRQYYESFSVGYQSTTHDFVQNLDMMNSSNMLQLDVKENSVVERDDRIKQGINYSYSSNIADALVTESQVANIFKWNTTTDTTTKNNTRTVNRQVPGIVCYYLGNDYNGKYTATIPYSTGSLNSVNYSTPSYYGAFYRTDETQSQIGLYSGNEACRIFMPGMNYTRGQLISPQQIWQPDRRVGDNNKGVGYNWQGQAIYHELVFKNRREGCQNANVDFIPGESTVSDNDPQGLATRVVLAQQKPYYHKRPWFNELDELFGVNTSKLADYITDKSIMDPQPITVIKPNTDVLSMFNVDFPSDGIYENIPAGNIGGANITGDYSDATYKIRFTTGSNVTSRQYLLYSSVHYNLYLEDGKINIVVDHDSVTTPKVLNKTINPNTTYDLTTQLGSLGAFYEVACKAASESTGTIASGAADGGSYTSLMRIGSNYNDQYSAVFQGNVDLTNSSVTRNNVTTSLTTSTTEIPKQFNKDLFTIIGSANLSSDGILTNVSNTAYVTADISNFNSANNCEILSPVFNVGSVSTGTASSETWFEIENKWNSATSKRIGFGFGVSPITVAGDQIIYYRESIGASSSLAQSFTTTSFTQIQFKIASTQSSESTANYTLSYKLDSGSWIQIDQVEATNDSQFDWTMTIGQITNSNSRLQSADLNPVKIATNNTDIIFEAETIPGQTPMTDEEFYKNYKLDYETWAKALDKPL